MQDIKGYSSFEKIEPVTKGWSSDRKYYIETKSGNRLFLRINDASSYNRKKFEFEMMKEVAAFGLPTPKPLAFGLCEDKQSVYSLFTWLAGEDAELALKDLTEAEQYALGIKTGKFLRQIHSIPAPNDQEVWETRFSKKTRKKIDNYAACEIKFPGDYQVIEYLESNWNLLKNRPQSFQHGDYHVGNMVLSKEQNISIIDFNRCDYGDPWEEFNRIVFSAKASPHFATGQLNGYFAGRPPLEFFQLLAFYIASNTLSAIPWAIPFGEKEITTMKNQAQDVLTWFDNMRNPVPSWYLGSELDDLSRQ